ncbi:sensor domain-containing diguanylate cyclase [Cereibacter changlensis JA139]|uniref:diguanylate cyclase n=3 Tax=Cereibacter changlensis TaxID=402884 RepID=A0A2T4JNA1_9RHOB|nr:sensor domain-containing diguanylate cyclase [Cereibacter changlensis]PTE19384.1 sensor domain-containing diguanylate cyclase [Cereibacter changlensis JA139]PZX46025.1 diguanylate cyclase (GGDEF)-like protein [Cereibacter changlensis]
MLSRFLRLQDEEGRIAALQRYEILDTAPEEEFESIISLLMSVFKAPVAAISLLDVDRQWFKASGGIGAAEVPRSASACEQVIRSGQVVAVEDARRDERFSAIGSFAAIERCQSYLGAPITTPDGYNIGSICIMGVEPRRFSSADHEVMRSFARLVMSQIELRLVASCDLLTGALSRKGFERAALDAFAAHRKDEVPSSLAFIDLDNLQRINDTYGRHVGDNALRASVFAAAQVLRRTDVIGRLGGDEFAILLRGAEARDAHVVMDRVRLAIEATAIHGCSGTPLTVSIGLTALKAEYARPETWFAVADSALVRAKQNGRNRVFYLA